jgi:hypothetical protein
MAFEYPDLPSWMQPIPYPPGPLTEYERAIINCHRQTQRRVNSIVMEFKQRYPIVSRSTDGL